MYSEAYLDRELANMYAEATEIMIKEMREHLRVMLGVRECYLKKKINMKTFTSKMLAEFKSLDDDYTILHFGLSEFTKHRYFEKEMMEQ